MRWLLNCEYSLVVFLSANVIWAYFELNCPVVYKPLKELPSLPWMGISTTAAKANGDYS